MTPEIVSRDGLIVIGIRMIIEMGASEVETIWREKFLPRRSELAGGDNGCYCVFSFLSDDAWDGRFEYVAGVAVDSLENIPAGMVGWVIPAGTYAESETPGLKNIGATCREVIADWLPDSGYRLVSSPMFAYTREKRPESGNGIWKVNIPVETPEVLAQLESWLR